MSKIIIALYVLTTSLALIVLKLGTTTAHDYQFNKLPFPINLYTGLGVAFYGVSFLLYIYLLSRYDLGYIIPLVTAFVYVLIFVASYFIFHEVFTVAKIAGIAFILVGLAFLNLGNK